jgi:hypothetical protein
MPDYPLFPAPLPTGNHESFPGAQKASHLFLKWQVTSDVEGMYPLI